MLEDNFSDGGNKGRLDVLENCVAVLQRKTRALVERDLAGLEENLEREAQLIVQLAELQASQRSFDATKDNKAQQSAAYISGSTGKEQTDDVVNESSMSLNLLKRVVREIQAVNKLNSALIQNDHAFCRALLAVLCPPATYQPSTNVDPVITTEAPTQCLISVQS